MMPVRRRRTRCAIWSELLRGDTRGRSANAGGAVTADAASSASCSLCAVIYIKKCFSTSIVGSRMVIDFNAGTTFNPVNITIDLSRTIIFLIII